MDRLRGLSSAATLACLGSITIVGCATTDRSQIHQFQPTADRSTDQAVTHTGIGDQRAPQGAVPQASTGQRTTMASMAGILPPGGGGAGSVVNDFCVDAETVGVPSNTVYWTDLASVDNAPTCGTSNTAPGVWYRVIGTGNVMNASTCSEFTTFDTKLTVYCGGCDNLLCVGGNDDDPDCQFIRHSRVSWCSELGKEYLILVHGFLNETGGGILNIWDLDICTATPDCNVGPPHDFCGDCISTATNQPIQSSTDGATGTDITSCAFNDTADAWHCWLADCTGTATMSLCGSAYDTTLAVFNDCGGVELICDDDGCGTTLQSELTLPVVIGTTYFIRVSGFNGATGSYLLNITCAQEPPGACCFSVDCVGGMTRDVCIAQGGRWFGGQDCATFQCPVACCFADGTCQDRSDPACREMGGTPQGPGTDCSTTTCPLPTEACCFPTGGCDHLSRASCLSQGGTPQGPNTSCTGVVCAPIGACCFNGSCVGNMPQASCEIEGGAWFVGQDCATFQCPVACCFADGTCQDRSDPACREMGGTPQGPGTDCSTTTCPLPTEACCFPTGGCDHLSRASCLSQGGTPQGPNTSCTGVVCEPLGACCFNGSCVGNMPRTSCEIEGGAWFVGQDCATFVCPEACCLADGNCVDGPRSTCLQQGGTPQGPGTNCATTSCPSPGACCFDDGSCMVTLPEECAVQGGTSQGANTNCAPNPCVPIGACCLNGNCVGNVPQVACEPEGGTWFVGQDCATFLCSEACCLSGGVCQNGSREECLLLGGAPQGPGTACHTTPCAPIGACCFNGACVGTMPQDTCVSDGGMWFADQDCATFLCPEACCHSDGTCLDQDRGACLQSGGAPQGPGSNCAATSCPILEACCFSEGNCVNAPSQACLIEGGFPQGANTDCDTTGCPPMGACCNGGTCGRAMPQTFCEQDGGVWFEGQNCLTFACPEACCFANGSCVDQGRGLCLESGGQPQGVGSACASTVCAPIGACCFDGSCVGDMPQNSCESDGGTWFVGESCETFLCPEACCLIDGTCQDWPLGRCLESAGEPQGPGTACASTICRQPTQACCFDRGGCGELPAALCLEEGGTPQGEGTNCDSVICPPAFIEVDEFPFSIGELELTGPFGSETIAVTGPTTVHVFFEGGEGVADDDDGNGRDEVHTEMVSLALHGMSPNVGPIVVTLNPNFATTGMIEERTNNTPGVLDLPPFTPGGTADSFFDIFFQVDVGGLTLFTVEPKRLSAVITNKPPGPGDIYENLVDIPLVDADGQPSGFILSATRHRPRPPVEIDEFDFSIGEFELTGPTGSQIIAMTGPATVAVYFEGNQNGEANDDDGDGLDEVVIEMIALEMVGLSPSLGPVRVTLNPNFVSTGLIEERANVTTGVLDLPPFAPFGTANSHFNLFFQIEVAGQTFFTNQPKRMSSIITHKPPGPGDLYENLEDIPLVDADGNPTGLVLSAARHRPRPPVEIDEFDFSIGELELTTPFGTETIAMTGPATVAVFFEGNQEGDADDDDGNGREEVVIEMIELQLHGLSPTLGPVVVTLNPNIPSTGLIEERTNNTPGTLDLPPFTPGGTADSFFDLFFQVHVVGQTFFTIQPKRMSAIITHKPPGPRDFYENLIDIPLVDAEGQPAQFILGATRHRPRPPVEIDQFDFSIGELEIIAPSGASEVIAVTGPATVAVFFEGDQEGDANDDDGNGREEVRIEMTDLRLEGLSPAIGPVVVTLNPALPTTGLIEERANNTPGLLDLPPFTPTGTADSFFDIFFQVEVAGQTLFTVTPKRMSSIITHKPPGPGDFYESLQEIPLVDAAGQPSGYVLSATRHRPRPPVEIDQFDFSIGELELTTPFGSEVIAMTGPATVAVYFEGNQEGDAHDDDGDGKDEVLIEMVDLQLNGLSPTLGPVRVRLNPNFITTGLIEERANNTPGTLDLPPFTPEGTADSFFDIFFQVEVGGQTLFTVVPKHMSSIITHKPPGPGDLYENLIDTPLVDANGQPTGFALSATRHRPRPPVEIDQFDFSIGELEFSTPFGSEIIAMTGPATVAVFFEGNQEGDANDDDGDGMDEVAIEMIDLQLQGLSPVLGLVRVTLNPNLVSTGLIEERANNTPGLLDLPPFTPTGTADSHFDLFFQVEVAGQTLFTVQPKHMSSVITHKPPGPGDIYENLEDIPLVNRFGFPTGITLSATRHRPRPPVEIDEFDFSIGELEIGTPFGTEIIAMHGPTTVAVYFEGTQEGDCDDDDGNGRDEVLIEMTDLQLHGFSPLLGPVHVTVNPNFVSTGLIEEIVNNDPGTLDLPPFTPTGTADSFFDIFFQVDVGGQSFFTVIPKRMSSIITHKPPGPGDLYENLDAIPLVNQFGFPTGFTLSATRHLPTPPCDDGDIDGDGDIDRADYAVFPDCQSGPAAVPLSESCRRCTDLTGDGDTDLEDIAQFQNAFTGSQ